MEETFPDPNTECVYLSKGNLIYLGNGKISVTELPDADNGYSIHPFLEEKPLILRRDLVNAYIFSLEDKSLTSVFPEDDSGNRILSNHSGIIHTWNLTEDQGYMYDYRSGEAVVTQVQYPPGYEGKYTNVILPTGGEGGILYIDNLNNNLRYKGRDLEMPDYERYDDVYYQWKPPYFLIGAEYIVFQYKLDPLEDGDKLEDYVLPPLEFPGYISGSNERGFTTVTEGGEDTYMPTITEGKLGMVKAPAIVDGNDPYRYPEISPAMDTFLWSLDAEPIVYTYRRLRDTIRDDPLLSESMSKLIAMYV